jgi:tetratricopeptide (TPR) repeat protein
MLQRSRGVPPKPKKRAIADAVRDLVLRIGGALIVLLGQGALSAQEVESKVAELQQQVQKYLQEQKPQLAIPLLREIARRDPKDINAQANLGALLFFQGDYGEAILHMRAAIQMQPDLWKIEALLGIAEKRTGNSKEAQLDLERACANLDDKKVQIQAGLELIELDSASGQLDKALAVAAKLEELDPRNTQLLFVVNRIARQMVDQSLLNLMLVAPGSAEMHLSMAAELTRQGDSANAIANYREAIRLNPAIPGAHFELAELLRTSPDPALSAQAEAEYRAALQMNQYDALSWRQLAFVLAAKGDYKAAEEDYKKALALQPKDSDAKTGLAIVWISMNRAIEAVSLLESAVQDDPANIVAHYRLSLLYRRAGRTADAQRELDTFNHYKDVKDKLGKVFKQLNGQNSPM